MQVIPQFLALVVVTFFMTNANATWTDKEEIRAAFKSCFQEQGIKKPEPGKKREKVDREKLDACLVTKGISKEQLSEMKEKRKAFKVARKACKEEVGDDRKNIRECLKAKGFERPAKNV